VPMGDEDAAVKTWKVNFT